MFAAFVWYVLRPAAAVLACRFGAAILFAFLRDLIMRLAAAAARRRALAGRLATARVIRLPRPDVRADLTRAMQTRSTSR